MTGPRALTDEELHHELMIRDAQDKVTAANALLEVRVIHARQVGMPWTLIARALGVTRQSAQQKFSRLPELAEGEEAR